MEALSERVKQLEEELKDCRERLACADDAQSKSKGARPKINVLSAEVVDSNPYRLLVHICLFLVFVNSNYTIPLLFHVFFMLSRPGEGS